MARSTARVGARAGGRGRGRGRAARAVRAAAAAKPRVAIAGVTGAVGQEFLQVLKERNFPYADMKMLASAKRSALLHVL